MESFYYCFFHRKAQPVWRKLFFLSITFSSKICKSNVGQQFVRYHLVKNNRRKKKEFSGSTFILILKSALKLEAVLKNFAIFTRKHLFLNKVAGLQVAASLMILTEKIQLQFIQFSRRMAAWLLLIFFIHYHVLIENCGSSI